MNLVCRNRLAAVVFSLAASAAALPGNTLAADDPLTTRVAAIEQSLDARLGVAVIDTGTDREWAYRGNERFPMMSTFKPLLCSLLLSQVDQGREMLDRRIEIRPDDLLEHAPVAGKHVGKAGMSLGELCEAAITQSDNTAANLVLERVGGPARVTAFLRSLGDSKTRLDRNEPTLNEARPGDERDTTMPVAMAGSLKQLVLGQTLSPASRRQLTDWLVANRTGDAKIRAGLPAGWRVGDKTGSGANGSMNDVAVIWPAGRKPVVLAIFITGTGASVAARNAAMADITRALVDTLPH
ncbi:class A beta-lactamase [Microvirgula aerodenitrificans]|uniref:class A beta-lactamase n=1 Tax=Microvirgula aerodenitrificans TaxID=57480 RepID=UPI002F40A8F4